MTFRMYWASSSPRLSRTSWRVVSSSLPMISMSSADRWAIGFWDFFCSAVTVRLLFSGRSVVDVAGAGGGAHAGLDEDAVTGRRGGDLAVAQVAYRTLAQRQDAAVADAHPAAARHEHSGVLGGIQDRGGAVGLEGRPGLREGHRPALAGHDDRRTEPLGVEPLSDAGRLPVRLQGLEHADRPAGPGRPLVQVGNEIGDRRGVEHPGGVRVLLHESETSVG